MEGLNSVDWDEERIQTLENVFHNSTQLVICSSDKVSSKTRSYILPNVVHKFIKAHWLTGEGHALMHIV